jgi:hypothetical protein
MGNSSYSERGVGPGRTHTDYSCLAKPSGYAPHELAGSVREGDTKIMAFVDDLTAAGLSLPVTTVDRAVIGSKEMAIIAADGNTIRLRGQTIAYVLQARG